MSRGTLLTEGKALADELQRAMDAAWNANQINRTLALQDAQKELYAALFDGLAGVELFGSWEPEYARALRVIDVALPAVMARARQLLGGAP